MNRRDFLRTTAAAGGAILPAATFAHLLPSPEDLICGHELRPGVRCERGIGHDWEHRMCEGRRDHEGKINVFLIHEWNDDRAVWNSSDWQVGRSMYYGQWQGMRSFERIMDVVIENARESLVPGSVFEIRSADAYPGMSKMAWFWRPAPNEIPRQFNPEGRTLKQSPLFRFHPLEGFVVRSGGYRLCARLKA